MTRIAYVCGDPGIPVFGHKGASVHVQEVVRALQRAGCRVELFAARVDGPPPPDLSEVAVHALPRIAKADLAERERKALAANAELRHALEVEGPFDLVYERYSLWSFAGMSYARATGTPALLEVNAPLIDEQARHRGLADPDAARQVAASVFTTATAVLAVSEDVGAWVRRHAERPAPVHVVPNGVDVTRFTPAAPGQRGPEDPLTVGFVGTLKPWHGVEALVRAAGMVGGADPRLRLLIVGEGPQREALERQVADEGLAGATTFTGALAPAEIPAALARMDVGVAPYPRMESNYFSPLKLFEYMAAGLAVVASDTGQAGQVVQHGRTGLLYPPGNAAALAAALRLLRDDPETADALGQAARAQVARDHTWNAVAKTISELAGLRTTRVPAGV